MTANWRPVQDRQWEERKTYLIHSGCFDNDFRIGGFSRGSDGPHDDLMYHDGGSFKIKYCDGAYYTELPDEPEQYRNQ